MVSGARREARLSQVVAAPHPALPRFFPLSPLTQIHAKLTPLWLVVQIGKALIAEMPIFKVKTAPRRRPRMAAPTHNRTLISWANAV